MTKFRVKLTALFMLFVGLSVLAAGLLAGNSYRHNHEAALRDHMTRELRVINAADPWFTGLDPAAQKTEFQRRALELKKVAGMRVTYIAPDGTVLGDSDHDTGTMDNHLKRPEVQQALKEGTGDSIRTSNTLGEKMMYVAMAVKSGGQLQGLVRLSMSLSDIDSSLNDVWLALIFSLFLLFALAAIVSYRVAKGVTQPLERMTSAAKRMSNLDYAIRVPEGGRDEIGELARALNLMAGNLQEQLDLISETGRGCRTSSTT